MKIESFSGIFIDERMYCVVEGDSALIIDAVISEKCEEYLKFKEINNLLIILTHEHIDHIYGVNWFRERFNCTVFCSKFCAERIINPKLNLAAFKEIIFSDDGGKLSQDYCCEADTFFENRDTVEWHEHEIELVETPGHSIGSICILIDDMALFTGDTLLKDIPLVTRLPGGSKKAYKEITLPFLRNISDEMMVYPGHGNNFLMRDSVLED